MYCEHLKKWSPSNSTCRRLHTVERSGTRRSVTPRIRTSRTHTHASLAVRSAALRGFIPIVHFNNTLLKVQQQMHIVNNMMQNIARRISVEEHVGNTSSMTRNAQDNITAARTNLITNTNLELHVLHDQHNLICNGTMLLKGGRAQPAARVWQLCAARALSHACPRVVTRVRSMSPSPHLRLNKPALAVEHGPPRRLNKARLGG